MTKETHPKYVAEMLLDGQEQGLATVMSWKDNLLLSKVANANEVRIFYQDQEGGYPVFTSPIHTVKPIPFGFQIFSIEKKLPAQIEIEIPTLNFNVDIFTVIPGPIHLYCNRKVDFNAHKIGNYLTLPEKKSEPGTPVWKIQAPKDDNKPELYVTVGVSDINNEGVRIIRRLDDFLRSHQDNIETSTQALSTLNRSEPYLIPFSLEGLAIFKNTKNKIIDMPKAKAKVFISYARKNNKFINWVILALNAIKNNDAIIVEYFFDKEDIAGGSEWEEKY
ncbi:MAG: toll/interleukin-1 receptor domain-containing protein [Lewinellaceae bacterium]|nr:toll/interleukin-1 receptor domain-containing protein [Lewinellaceae bacterium]